MNITEIPAKPKEERMIRVAAYARVSSDKDAAFHSLEAQTEYYEQYIAVHPDWALVGIYSDNAISGTTLNRPEFQRMLEDCRAGKIDLVITKSVTRFARNTVILLETIRELKKLGVDTYFEKEDMHGISPDGELLITLLAMYAEEEARSASENQIWRIRKLYENGEAAGGHTYGYRWEGGKLSIVPEEAEIVRQIYADYLSGMGKAAIAKKLTQDSIPTKYGQTWAAATVGEILTNEKYIGDMLLQKKYRSDFKTKKLVKNHGERRQYYVENSHEPIIDRDTFTSVQTEIKKRRGSSKATRRSAPITHLFSGLIRCGCCGYSYRYSRTHARQYDKRVWICPRAHTMGKSICPAQRIPESILIEQTKAVLEVEVLDRALLLDKLESIIVPEHNHLTYCFKNGSSTDIFWEHPSRRLSWTPAMRQRAREKALKQHGKESK